MLGCLRMSISQSIAEFQKLGHALYSKKRSRTGLHSKYDTLYSKVLMQEVIRKHCKRHKGNCAGMTTSGSDSKRNPGTCKSLSPPLLDCDYGYTDPHNTNWQRGLNSTLQTCLPAKGDVSIEGKKPTSIVSLGIGSTDQDFKFELSWPGPFNERSKLLNKFIKHSSARHFLIDPNEAEEGSRRLSELADGTHTWFKRFSVDKGMERIKIDEWENGSLTDIETGEQKEIPGGKTLQKIQDAVQTYLTREYDPAIDDYAAPKVMLNQLAEYLVRKRRAREQLSTTSDELKERYDRFMGKYLTGEFIDQPDCVVSWPKTTSTKVIFRQRWGGESMKNFTEGREDLAESEEDIAESDQEDAENRGKLRRMRAKWREYFVKE
ncbi:uncharacterized protein K452DRAFT_359205 [Aplosporella prunicola CBS 121167]|uniref:Uncharacterized protein n=1 Tax=Aplosporella prunicola CBS 121167 TaxID=1176127 RepID=A0A6A6BG29_9PEZI|nr:uncharacterized protein K452DRAFT_359205 [Aplosporella prunicola CBS 121167]KAF2141461.1 hypothetical protein K452DRAFT_359205 [Aplosporella prunicola CBS 121167]